MLMGMIPWLDGRLYERTGARGLRANLELSS
jgi:hypothetical protein